MPGGCPVLTPAVLWANAAPENRQKARALGMRLAVAYADSRPDRVAELFPDDPDTVMHLHVVFAEAANAFANGGAAPPLDYLRVGLNQVLDSAPADIRHLIFRMFDQHVTASRSGELAGALKAATADDPRVTAHLGAAVLAVLALGVTEPMEDGGSVRGVERLRRNADRLDPPDRVAAGEG